MYAPQVSPGPDVEVVVAQPAAWGEKHNKKRKKKDAGVTSDYRHQSAPTTSNKPPAQYACQYGVCGTTRGVAIVLRNECAGEIMVEGCRAAVVARVDIDPADAATRLEGDARGDDDGHGWSQSRSHGYGWGWGWGWGYGSGSGSGYVWVWGWDWACHMVGHGVVTVGVTVGVVPATCTVRVFWGE